MFLSYLYFFVSCQLKVLFFFLSSIRTPRLASERSIKFLIRSILILVFRLLNKKTRFAGRARGLNKNSITWGVSLSARCAYILWLIEVDSLKYTFYRISYLDYGVMPFKEFFQKLNRKVSSPRSDIKALNKVIASISFRYLYLSINLL